MPSARRTLAPNSAATQLHMLFRLQLHFNVNFINCVKVRLMYGRVVCGARVCSSYFIVRAIAVHLCFPYRCHSLQPIKFLSYFSALNNGLWTPIEPFTRWFRAFRCTPPPLSRRLLPPLDFFYRVLNSFHFPRDNNAIQTWTIFCYEDMSVERLLAALAVPYCSIK